MGTGKTTVGRKLARKLGRRFVDLDRRIEERAGKSIKEIFQEMGEKGFRKLESAVLKEILRPGGQVVATGGGVVTRSENLRLLKKRAFLVCLAARPEVLLKRIGKNADRPLLEVENREQKITDLLKQRQAAYSEADLTVDTTALTIDEVVEQILKSVEDPSASSNRPRSLAHA